MEHRALSELSGVPKRTIEDLETRGDGRTSTFLFLLIYSEINCFVAGS